METLILINACILFGSGLILFQSRNLIRIFLGTFLSAHALHLVIFLAGKSQSSLPAFTGTVAAVSNPLPQALILTSIVISFAVGLICLGMAYSFQSEESSS